MTTTFVFITRKGGEITIQASTEAAARREAMIKLYGDQPDRVTPHAPNYSGHGLILKAIREESTP